MRVHKTMVTERNGGALGRAARAAFPGGAKKRVAGLLGVSLAMAHEILHRGYLGRKRREWARALLAELDRQDREERAAARRLLRHMAEDDGEMAGFDRRMAVGAGGPEVAAGAARGAVAGRARRATGLRAAALIDGAFCAAVWAALTWGALMVLP